MDWQQMVRDTSIIALFEMNGDRRMVVAVVVALTQSFYSQSPRMNSDDLSSVAGVRRLVVVVLRWES